MPIKPVISYKAEKRPFTLDNNDSIVRRKVSKTEYQNWINRKEFTDFVDSLYAPSISDTYVYIVCQCGHEYIYATKLQVPSLNLTCSCGRKVIQYGN